MKRIALLSILVPVLAAAQGTEYYESKVNTAARLAGDTAEVCVTNSAGGTTVTRLAGAKALELQNLGPNSIFCTVDGGAPTADNKHGRKVAADAAWSIDVGPNITVKCIAATAAQVTGACTMVTQLR